LKYAEQNGFNKVCLTNHFWDERVEGASNWYLKQNFEHISEAKPLPQSDKVLFLFGCETDLRQDLLLESLKRVGFLEFFDLVYGVNNLDGASKLERGKELAAALKDGISSAVIIGDTLHDAEVASALGAKCVLISCGHQDSPRFAELSHPVADSLVEAVMLASEIA
jgi:phosphoglycolate phosphatase